MSDYVLFSNIGTTDPIRNGYDGPFLHIVRKYKPKKAYIFLTKEMCDIDEKYNAYERAAKEIDKNIEIIKKKYKDIDKPNNFLVFDDKYEDILDEITRENPDSKVLINISSGTPQMICSLYNITANSNKQYNLIQVITPDKKGNKSEHIKDFSNIENLVAESMDSSFTELEGIENRCRLIEPTNIRKQTIERVIREHIKIYDYEGAVQAAKEADKLIDKEVLDLLQYLNNRYKLEFNKLNKDRLPIQSGDVRNIFEYILYLQIKLERNELIDFTRGISPVLTDLFEECLKSRYNIKIRDYCEIKTKFRNGRNVKVLFLSREKLPKDVLSIYDERFFSESNKDSKFITTELSAANILPFIEYKAKDDNDKTLYNYASMLREFEMKFRNIAAHQISSISNEKIKTEMNNFKNKPVDSKKILEGLKSLFEIAFNKNYKKQIDWNSYDNMNKEILEKLNDRGEESGVLSESYN